MSRTYLTLLITVVLGIVSALLFPYASVTPGVLIDGHAALKQDCFACHTIGKGATTGQCTACHAPRSIGKMTTAGVPLVNERSRSILIHTSVADLECFQCHSEHNGSSKSSATAAFSHELLNGQHRTQCAGCHSAPSTYIHSIPSIACVSCHTTSDWRLGSFDHSLPGTAVQRCTDCHTPDMPADDLHRTVVSQQQCGGCHSTNGWKPSTYDHTKYFRFDANHPASCNDCHPASGGFKTYTCYSCHEHTASKMAQKHQKEGIQNFEKCVKCHRSGDEHDVSGRGGNGNGSDGERQGHNSERENDDD